MYSLTSKFVFASVKQESSILDLGSGPDITELLKGWSTRQQDRKRRMSFRWGLGSKSAFKLFIVDPRPVSLGLLGRPIKVPSDTEQTVTLLFNGEAVGSFAMKPGLHEYRIEIPKEEVRQGENRVVLQYGYVHRPSDPTLIKDSRALAVAWYRIRLYNSVPIDPEGPKVVVQESLVVPFSTQIDYFLKVPAGGILVVDNVQFLGTDSGTLSIHLQPVGERESRIGVTSNSGRFVIDLSAYSTQPVRMSIRAFATQPLEGVGKVILSSPMIWALPDDDAAPQPLHGPIKTPNVVFYVIDTLRADHLGCYGYDLPISPAIDSFAADGGALFENALAQSSWTKPAVASILTGLWPLSHGAIGGSSRVSESVLTLAEILQSANYSTAAFGANPNIHSTFGFGQGFDTLESLDMAASSRRLNEMAFDWLRNQPRGRPFFLYIHSMDVHPPYADQIEVGDDSVSEAQRHVSEELRDLIGELHRYGNAALTTEQQRQIISLYDERIAFNDRSFEQLIGFMRQEGIYQDSIIVLVADHGEEFFDHGTWGHRKNLRSAAVRIPLIIQMPHSTTALRLQQTVQQVDIAPTILEYLGIPSPRAFQGRSLLPLVGTRPPPIEDWASRPVFQYLRTARQTQVAVVQDGWKLLVVFRKGALQDRLLYWVATDAAESQEVSKEHPIITGYLYSLMRQWLEETRTPPSESSEVVIDEELQESLRALGYLD